MSQVIVEMNQPTAGYFLRAVTQTGCPSACVNTGLGQANGISKLSYIRLSNLILTNSPVQYEGAPLTLPTSTSGNKTAADFAYCLDEPIASIVPWVKKSGGTVDAFQASASLLPAGFVTQVQSPEDGNVFRWFLNNGAIQMNYTQPTLKSLAEGLATQNNTVPVNGSSQGLSSSAISNPIYLRKANEWYYFVIQNQFFASHPMHLHGHDMSVLGQGQQPWTPALTGTLNFDNPVRRDTAMLTGSRGPGSPPGYTVIGFQSDNPGAWLMHCHIVWHVEGGLALQWIELPDEIPAEEYVSKPSFEGECSALESYYADGGARLVIGESGLKKKSWMDEMMTGSVVRRAADAPRRFLDGHLKRSRHF
jgi:hypothetical protein